MSFVVPTTLAATEDFETWTGTTAPANIEATLRGCTTIVLAGTKTARYATDPETGLATTTATREALRDATCIQAAAWVALNIDPATGGVMQTAKTVRRKKLGTAEVEYTEVEAKAVTAARAAAYSFLVPEAAAWLRNRGLITTVVGAP